MAPRTNRLLAFANSVLMREATRHARNQPQHYSMSRRFTAAQAAPAEQPDYYQEPILQRQPMKVDLFKEAERHQKDNLGKSSLLKEAECRQTDILGKSEKRKVVTEMNWAPHPRTGIYFPEGQDWVMDDVPENAASFGEGQTYWLRNIDGVEKPDPDLTSADHYLCN